MDFNSIFSNAFRYPLSDYKKLLIVGIIVLLAEIPTVGFTFGLTTEFSILAVLYLISIVFGILLAGYLVSVIIKGTQYSDDIPDLDFKKNFIDGLKSIVVSFIYLIIPTVILFIVALLTGAIGASLNHIGASIIIVVIVAIILYIVFGILEVVALARFAYYDDWSEALHVGKVIDDAKGIGILNIIIFLVMLLLVFLVLAVISGIIGLIPFVGVIIVYLIVGSYAVLFYGDVLGLVYAEYAENTLGKDE